MLHREYSAPWSHSWTDLYASEVRGTNRHSKQPGYTSAVDMWSIGCVTSVLFTGSSAFVVSQVSADRQASAAAMIEAAAKCDLRRLDDSKIWDGIDTRAKDFIKHLLVLDEGQRLTANQALTHRWFTQKRSRQSIEDRYNQAISDWTIRSTARDFKKDIAHFIDRRIPKDDVSSARAPPAPSADMLRSHESVASTNGISHD